LSYIKKLTKNTGQYKVPTNSLGKKDPGRNIKRILKIHGYISTILLPEINTLKKAKVKEFGQS